MTWLPWEHAWSSPGERLFVERQTEDGHTRHRFRSDGAAEGTVVIAHRDGKVLLIEVDRPAVRQRLLELPRGQGEPEDRNPIATGVRELSEETGEVLIEPIHLGWIYPDSGLQGDRVHVILGEVAQPGNTRGPAEYPRQRWLTPSAIDEMIRVGTMRDGISLSALRLQSATRPG